MKKTDMTCMVAHSRGMLPFPAYAIKGNWAVTPPSMGGLPYVGAKWAVVTHLPTGYRAIDIPKASDYTAVLDRFNRMFGNAVTVRGVMRKYSKLSPKDKKLIQGRTPKENK